ncbi:MAG: hypothetical protein AAF702_04305 [Chloroflexota bacterium]
MKVTQKAFSGPNDLQAMTALANDFPYENLHVADLSYRFSSWAMDFPENIQVWTDDDGKLAGWAFMQSPFWAIDYAYHPEVSELHP